MRPVDGIAWPTQWGDERGRTSGRSRRLNWPIVVLSLFPVRAAALPDPAAFIVVAVVTLAILLVVLLRAMHTIRPYEAGVLTIFGTYKRVLRPGLNLVSPLARVVRLDLRTRRVRLEPWSVPVVGGQVRLAGTVSYHVVDAARATFQTTDLEGELVGLTKSAATQSLRGVDLGRAGAAALELTPSARDDLDQRADRFGVKVESVGLELATM